MNVRWRPGASICCGRRGRVDALTIAFPLVVGPSAVGPSYHDENAFPPNPFRHKRRKMTSAIDAPRKSTRYFELDSLRGLAALVVLANHLEMAWSNTYPVGSAIGRSLVNLTLPFGPEAVILFFVLSGFVLSLPAVEGRPQSYFTFVTRRVFRIYFPYLVALAVSVAAASCLYHRSTGNNWVLSFWSEPVQWSLVGQHVMFLGVYDTTVFDLPIWSLVHEMRISLFFPLLCAIVFGLKNKWAFALAICLTTLASGLEKKYPVETMTSLADTLNYTTMFILGICIARERTTIAHWFSRISRPVRLSFGVASLLLLAFAWPGLTPLTMRIFHLHFRLFAQWPTALGAGGLIVICLNSPSCKRILHWPPIHFLGEISYSLYLWHFIVLLFCVHLLYGKMPLWVIISLALVLSILVSWCSYIWIEKPSMNLGRKLSNVFQRRPAGSSA
jgi:peptidoglycan/LPS O-acetylase OafA/YrhL